MEIQVAESGKRLLLLARTFPYSNGEVAAESYLETEIGILANRFEEIVAVGTEAPKGAKPTCELPANVRPMALGVGNSKADKVSEAVQGGALRLFGPPSVREALSGDSAANTFGKQGFLCYFVARAYRKYEALLEALAALGLQPTHVYSFWFWDTALTAAWLKEAYPCTFAFARAHGYDLYSYRSPRCYLPLREYLLERLDWVFPCSADGRDFINAKWPGHEHRVATAYLGTRDLADRSRVVRTGAFRIASCSRVVPVKRVGLIADAMALLDADGVQAEWTHFGDGADLSDVKAKISNLSNVRCEFPGTVPNSELLEIYGQRDFDLFVNVSESEGLPISLMEACGAGIPVLATDVGGTCEIVRPGLNGDLLPEGISARKLADALKAFAELPDGEYLSLRRGARRVWEEDFRAAKNVGMFVDTVLGINGGMRDE